VLLLVEFDMELDDSPEKDIDGQGKRAASAQKHGRAIELLVDHVHSIPVCCPPLSFHFPYTSS
jgi:hypothetical protein